LAYKEVEKMKRKMNACGVVNKDCFVKQFKYLSCFLKKMSLNCWDSPQLGCCKISLKESECKVCGVYKEGKKLLKKLRR